MAESKIKDENYYQISGFMINRLGLKGVPLNVYAIIYGFSQDGESEFTGSLQYLCDFCGGVSKPTIINALKVLTEAGYIIRRDDHINSITLPRYKANLPILKNFNGGIKETLPNNKTNNSIYNEVVVCADEQNNGDYDNKLMFFRGKVLLSENQIADLLEKIDLEAFEYYIDKLNTFLNKKNTHVKNHYATILKWYNEDCAVKA